MAKVTSRSRTVKANGKRRGTRRSTSNGSRGGGWDKAKLIGGMFVVGTAATMFSNWQAGKTINLFSKDYYK